MLTPLSGLVSAAWSADDPVMQIAAALLLTLPFLLAVLFGFSCTVEDGSPSREGLINGNRGGKAV